jgi:CheY-like chemotaxis protein
MPPLSLIFFDDYPLQSENVLFVESLRRKLGHLAIHVEIPKTFNGVEECLRTVRASVIILDIMAKIPAGYTGSPEASSSLAGLEVLRKCRVGAYGPLNQETPIFMRTARGEPHVRKLCLQAGAVDYCLVGTDDEKLASSIRRILEKQRE